MDQSVNFLVVEVNTILMMFVFMIVHLKELTLMTKMRWLVVKEYVQRVMINVRNVLVN